MNRYAKSNNSIFKTVSHEVSDELVFFEVVDDRKICSIRTGCSGFDGGNVRNCEVAVNSVVYVAVAYLKPEVCITVRRS